MGNHNKEELKRYITAYIRNMRINNLLVLVRKGFTEDDYLNYIGEYKDEEELLTKSIGNTKGFLQ